MLENIDGEVITGDKPILNYCKTFFESLHQSRGNETDYESIMHGFEIPRLSLRAKLSCAGQMTVE